jgi:hypothetical protein
LYRAYQNCFDPDLGGDRDYDYIKKQSKLADGLYEQVRCIKPETFYAKFLAQRDRNGKPHTEENAAYLAERARKEYEALVAKAKRAMEAQTFFEMVQAALVFLTHRLLSDKLLPEFARMRTMREEKQMQDRNMNIYLLYRKWTDPPPDGYGEPVKVAYAKIFEEWGISRPHAEKVVASKHEDVTGEKRKQGRPKRKAS